MPLELGKSGRCMMGSANAHLRLQQGCSATSASVRNLSSNYRVISNKNNTELRSLQQFASFPTSIAVGNRQ